MLWSQSHAPAGLNSFAGNKEAVMRAKQWALGFTLGKPSKPLLLHGPSGCGKSALARAIAKQMNWNVIALDPPPPEEKERWERQAASAFSGSSLFGEPSLVLVEDIDSWSAAKARSAITLLISHLSSASVPVILTAIDPYERSLSALRTHCELLPLKAVNSSDMSGVLSSISEAEKTGLSAEQIKAIVSNSSGDLRAAIGDLQACNLSALREHDRSLLERVRAYLRAPNLKASRAVNLTNLAARDTLKLYICENLPNEIIDAADRAEGYNRLSRADVFDGRIMRRQYWGYLRYSSDLMSWGVASARRHPSAAFIPYMFPSYIQKMGATKSRRSLRKQLSAKISALTHTTTRRAADFIPLVQAQALSLSSSGAQALSAYYSFDEDEMAGLLETAPSSMGKPAPPSTRLAAKRKTPTRPKPSA